MNPRTIIVAVLALVFGAATTIAVLRARTPKQQQVTPVETTTIVVAAETIAPGTLLAEEMLTTVEFPSDYVQPEFITDVEEVVGKRSSLGLIPNEVLTEAKVGARNPSGDIPEGMVAVSLSVGRAEESAGGWVYPNDYVDLILQVENPEFLQGEKVSLVLFEQVKVFAIGEHRTNVEEVENFEKSRSVTLIVTPEQAQQISLTEGIGKYTMVVCSPEKAELEDGYTTYFRFNELLDRRQGELEVEADRLRSEMQVSLFRKWDEEYFPPAAESDAEPEPEESEPEPITTTREGVILKLPGSQAVGRQKIIEQVEAD